MALNQHTRQQLQELKQDMDDGLLTQEDFNTQKALVLAANNKQLQAGSGLLGPEAGPVPRATATVVGYLPPSGPPQVREAPARGLLRPCE